MPVYEIYKVGEEPRWVPGLDLVGEALGRGQDPGDRETVARYARLRTGDVAGRVFGVDLLNRSLLSDALPIQFARAVALGLAHNLPQVRKMMLTEGMRA